MVTADEALARLTEGNRRFVSGEDINDLTKPTAEELLRGQNPFAIVLGCSDSRVPVEVVFDQGVGDLFVIRVAGNVVASSQIGSIEYAAESFGVQLVVVLGHTQCGAVTATVDQLRQPSTSQSRGLRSIVERIRPSVESLLDSPLRDDVEALKAQAVRANVRMSASFIRYGSEILENRFEKGLLRIVGAEYSLETGQVEFFYDLDGAMADP